MTTSNRFSRRSALKLGLAGSAATLANRRAWAQPARTVKVALLAPMTGYLARNGQMMQSGAEMGIDDINNAGGIKALGGARMELTVIDAGESTEKATDAARRMVAQYPDLIGGTGAWLSSFTLAVTEVTERAELPWLTLSYSDAITSRGFRYIFQMAPTSEDQARSAIPAYVAVATQATGKAPTTIAFISENTASATSFMKQVRESALKDNHLTAVADETYTPPLADATAMAQRVRNGRPQLLLVQMSAIGDLKVGLDKLAEYHLGADRLPKIGSGGTWGAPELAQVIGPDIVQGCMGMVGNWPGKGQEDIIRRFVERTKEPWLNQDAFMTYIDMMVLKEAAERAGVADRRKVADAIRAFDLHDEGPAKFMPSRHLQFDANGRLVDAQLVIIQWQNGAPKPIWPPNVATASPIWPKG
jgi:branched-chain amino acid transport system substrate-binding protein